VSTFFKGAADERKYTIWKALMFSHCSFHASVIAEELTEKETELYRHAPALLSLVERYASECSGCSGSGVAPPRNFHTDEGPCPDCADIRAAIASAKGDK
jgi:hypothetical protein